MPIDVTVSAQVPDDVQVLGVPVFAGRRQPDKAPVELDVAYLGERGFEGKAGEACAVPADDGSTVVAIGMGKPDEVSVETFRRAGAAFAKAAWNDTRAAIAVLDAAGELDKGVAAQALAEGAVRSTRARPSRRSSSRSSSSDGAPRCRPAPTAGLASPRRCRWPATSSTNRRAR